MEWARFEAIVGSYSVRANDRLRAAVPRLLHGVAEAYGVDVAVEYSPQHPVNVNDLTETAAVHGVIEELFGPESHLRIPASRLVRRTSPA
ncbi:MAG: hypothetical protein L0H61_10765, partial [Micrococcaceae bacterium]|nr:hypothetical protein [Micrococcaceae bacterium]